MKKRMMWLVALLLAPLTLAYAAPAHANAGVSVNLPGFGLSVGPGGVGLNIGLPWVVAPAPVPAPAYGYPDDSYEPVVMEEVPEFVQPPELGFYVAVGVPYDLFYYNNSYYMNRGNIWYNSPYYNGPWSSVYYSNVPYVFNRFPFERIRHYRDSYYGRYQRYGAWNGYNHFSPGHRDNYREGIDRYRRSYARPQNPDRSYQNRAYVRPPNYGRQATGQGFTSDRPVIGNRVYRDNRAYSNRPLNAARPAYNQTNGTQRYGSRPAQVSHSSFAPASANKPAYYLPRRNGYNSPNTRQYVTSQGNERKEYNQPKWSHYDNATRGWQGERR